MKNQFLSKTSVDPREIDQNPKVIKSASNNYT